MPARSRPDSAPAAPAVPIAIQTSPRRRSPIRSPPRPQTSSAMQTKGVVLTQEGSEEHRIQKETQQVEETPLPPSRQLNPKTPVVTGAWIDTPKPVTSRPSSLKESIPPNSNTSRPSLKETVSSNPSTSPAKKAALAALQRAKDDEPKSQEPQSAPAPAHLPSSALSAVVDQARHHQSTDMIEMYGEATIESLEDLMSPHDDHSIQEVDEDTLDKLELPTGKPKTAAEKSRMAELVTLKSMNMKLNATKSNIRSVSHGIQRVEKQIHDSEGKEKEKGKDIQQPQVQIVVCEYSAAPFSALWQSSKSIFYTWDENGKFKFTRLGLIITVFWTWFITEFIMWYVLPSPSSAYCILKPKQPSLLPPTLRNNNVRLWHQPQRTRIPLCNTHNAFPSFPSPMETFTQYNNYILALGMGFFSRIL
jgi:hypothetical protein